MTLPNVADAVIDAEKVRDYLLSDSHPIGRFKATYFRSLGFNLADWESLRDALLAHAREGNAAPGQASLFGQKYEVRGTLVGPSDRGEVISVWIVRSGEEVPRFVTAYPR